MRTSPGDGVEVLGAGADVTTIHGTGSGSVVTADGVGSGTTLDGFTITGGSADYGGGMYNHNSSPTVTNCNFSGNSADDGGGMYNNDSSPVVTNCTFYNNTAIWGGGMSNSDLSSPTVTNCTFSDNSATNNGGGMCNDDSSPTITNNIITSNGAANGGGIFTDGSLLTISYNDVWGNAPDDYFLCIPGLGDISEDPLFADGDFHLGSSSPCIDAGNNAAPSLPARTLRVTTVFWMAITIASPKWIWALTSMSTPPPPRSGWMMTGPPRMT